MSKKIKSAITSKTVVLLPVTQIHVREDNPKKHTATQIKAIMDSIKANGFLDPIAVDKNGIIVEGHGRFTAVRRLMKDQELPMDFKVPAIRLNTDEADAILYGITHNQLQLSTGMDMGLLREELVNLEADAGELTGIGFGSDEVAALAPTQEEKKEAAQSNRAVAKASNETTDYLPLTHRVNLRFATEEERTEFNEFLGTLKSLYPGEETHAARITKFITDSDWRK